MLALPDWDSGTQLSSWLSIHQLHLMTFTASQIEMALSSTSKLCVFSVPFVMPVHATQILPVVSVRGLPSRLPHIHTSTHPRIPQLPAVLLAE